MVRFGTVNKRKSNVRQLVIKLQQKCLLKFYNFFGLTTLSCTSNKLTVQKIQYY